MAGSGSKCTKLLLQIANFLIILIGTGMLSYGIYQAGTRLRNWEGFRPERLPYLLANYTRLSGQHSSGVRLAVSGAFSLLIGLGGFVSITLQIRRAMLMYLSLLAISLIVCVAFLSMVFTNAAKPNDGLSFLNMRDTIRDHYGNLSGEDSTAITKAIDLFQAEKLCCGWSGRIGLNLFLLSPWARSVNELDSSLRNGSGIAFPDSCCTGAASNQFDQDLCVRARHEGQARNLGYIHSKDCLTLVQLPNPMMQVMVVQYLMLIVLKAMCIVATALELMYNTGERSKPAEARPAHRRQLKAGSQKKSSNQKSSAGQLKSQSDVQKY